MAEEPETELDRQVSALSTAFAAGVKRLATMPTLREGLLKAALTDLVWELYFEFPDCRDMLHDELGSLGMAVQSAMREDEIKSTSTSN